MSVSSYDPNRQGWGFAGVVCLLTAGLFFTAYTIHSKTYRHPRDPMATQVYHDRDAAGGGHGPAAAGDHGAAGAAGDHGAAGHDSAAAKGGHADSSAGSGRGH